ncbi:disease resistance CC-NBS-LRR class family protein [Tanacetum coccineum]
MGIAQTIVENNDSPPQDKARANIFLRKHIDDGLKFEYLQLKIQLKFYGQSVTDADMLEKIYSIFHASNINELLMTNHQSRPTRSLAYPEVNATKNDPKSFMHRQGQSHGKGRGRIGKNNSHGHNLSFDQNKKIGRVHTHGRGFTRGHVDLIEGIGKANFILPNGTKFLINNVVFSPKSSRNLLSFGDIYLNGYDTQTTTIENEKYLHIIDKSNVLEKLSMLHSGLHYTHLSVAESHMVIKEKSCDPGIVSLWHDRLGHPGSTMMKRIIESTHGHPLKDQKILQMDKMAPCASCSLGKLIARPSPLKGKRNHLYSLKEFKAIFVDRYIHHVDHLDILCKRVRLDNDGEFISQAFNDYCMSVGIVVEHPVAHVYTQNGLAESLIKRLQLIARPLIVRTKLPVSRWGHAILHAASLIRMRPSANHVYSPMQLAFYRQAY